MNEQIEETVEGESEELDFENPAFKFVPNELHDWRQQGPYLICKSCEIQHATFVGMGKRLTGMDKDGKPILVSL